MLKHLLCILCISLTTFGYSASNDAKQVFNRLVLVMGNSNVPKPQLLILDNKQLVAKTFPSGEVMIGKQFIQHCSLFGPDSINALACVLSHELVHYYQKHFWAQNFGSAYVDSDWGKKISEDENNRKFIELYETQADQLGFYYAFSAGYKTWRIGKNLLDSTYRWYQLKENLDGYPSLTQRKLMVETSSNQFSNLIPVFEMSNMLKVISSNYLGDQQSALLDFCSFGYEHLMSANIQTPEMYNNMAVAKILKAQKYTASKFSSLKLPVILDEQSLMYEASGSRGEDDVEQFNTLMNEAMEHLDKALKLDPYYWPASLNRSIVLMGQEKFGACQDELNSKAIAGIIKDNPKITTAINEMKGILYFYQGDLAKSKQSLNNVIKAGSVSAGYNQLILTDEFAKPMTEASLKTTTDTIEKWNGTFVYKGLKNYKTGFENVITYSNTKAEILRDTFNGYKIFELRQKIGFCPVQYVKIAVKNNVGLKTSRGLKEGSTLAELQKLYGVSIEKTEGTLLTYYSYLSKNLVVMVNKQTGKVENWFYFIVI